MSVPIDSYEEIGQLVSKAEQFVERRNPEALPLAEEIMQIAIRNGSLKQFAQAKYVMAFYNCLVANDYDKAISICHDVLEKTEKDDLEGTAYKIYMTLGNSYQLKGEVFSAQESYMKGLKELEDKSSLSGTEKGFLASFYYNLSLVWSSTELKISAEDYLEKAIQLNQETGNNFKLSKCYNAYGDVLEKKGDYPRAIEYIHKSLEIDRSLNEPFSIAISQANIGILRLRLKEIDTANEYLNESLEYFSSNNMDYYVAMVKVNIGQVLHAIGQKVDGINTLREAETIFEKLDNKNEQAQLYSMLAKFIAEEKDFETALNYQLKYTEHLKGIFDVEKTNALTRAKKEFETEQKEKETELLRQKNDEINHYVNQLERSNNELKQFAHVASHDLREPLRMITSYITLLQKTLTDKLSPQQHEFMTFAIDGAKRMEQLIMDLLRLAKVDANPRIEKVNLSTVAEEIKLNLEVLIQEKNALIVYDDLPPIMADRTMISQLFQNIVGNGMKYNESGQPTIRIKHRMVKGHLEITISDNGIGIPEALREKAFQIFQRLPTQKKYSGSGIGLSICKKIVETFDGRISIDDNPTGGSVFVIEFPASIIPAG
jgi:signal transduction histidine kinase